MEDLDFVTRLERSGQRRMRLSRLGTDSSLPPDYQGFRAASELGRSILAAGQPSSCRPTTDRGCKAAIQEAAPPKTRGRAGSLAATICGLFAPWSADAARKTIVAHCDEIHADIVYPGNTHIPLASLHPEIAARTITSATKSFNIPALRCAVMHFGAPALKEGFEKRIPSRLLGSPGALAAN